jgi:hypothetical protein
MNIKRIILYFISLVLLFIFSVLFVINFSLFSEDLGPGEITGTSNSIEFVEDKFNRQSNAKNDLNVSLSKQILFGDLHVHSTFSADAHQGNLPIVGGTGVHPVADACDFARHCSALDFWAITDHAEASTPKRWQETKETVRKCNALSADKENPDCVAFLGWEWTQVGATRNTHWGHHNVILKDEADDLLPPRAIASKSVARNALLNNAPEYPNSLFPLIDIKNFKNYNDFRRYISETKKVPICPENIPSKELPLNCHEEAVTPLSLANKVEEYTKDYLIIPHGQTWGFYTPKAYTLDKGLELSKQYPQQFDLLEIHSGHGNSEEYRSWRAATVVREGEIILDRFFGLQDGRADLTSGTFKDKEGRIFDIGTQTCPDVTDEFTPICARAGEVIFNRCIGAGFETTECDVRRKYTEQAVVDRGRNGWQVVPHFSLLDRIDSGQCKDCFSPAFNYVPGGSAQYGMALTKFNEDGSKHRFKYGFISSSDNHQAAPGSGYKELFGNNIDFSGPSSKFTDKLLHGPTFDLQDRDYVDPVRKNYVSDDKPIKYETSDIKLGFNTIEFERQRGFLQTGGLAAVHTEGRSKEQIWSAFKRHETYATSGPRILLWFNMLNGNEKIPMGAVRIQDDNPTFEVKAMGSFEQKVGCPEDAYTALGANRVEQLCYDECYNPSDVRKTITRIEVVRVMPQEYENQPVEDRIQDPWLVHNCPKNQVGCEFNFTDNEFESSKIDMSYYVRAIEEPSMQINTKGVRCERDAEGNCISVNICTQDWRRPRDVEACSELDEPRAWSSPIYVDYKQ